MISLKQLVATVTRDLEIWLKSSLFAFTEAELMGKSLGRDCMLFEIVTYIIGRIHIRDGKPSWTGNSSIDGKLV